MLTHCYHQMGSDPSARLKKSYRILGPSWDALAAGALNVLLLPRLLAAVLPGAML